MDTEKTFYTGRYDWRTKEEKAMAQREAVPFPGRFEVRVTAKEFGGYKDVRLILGQDMDQATAEALLRSTGLSVGDDEKWRETWTAVSDSFDAQQVDAMRRYFESQDGMTMETKPATIGPYRLGFFWTGDEWDDEYVFNLPDASAALGFRLNAFCRVAGLEETQVEHERRLKALAKSVVEMCQSNANDIRQVLGELLPVPQFQVFEGLPGMATWLVKDTHGGDVVTNGVVANLPNRWLADMVATAMNAAEAEAE